MKIKTIRRCPHCDKAIRVREIQMDKASQEEVQQFFKTILNIKD